MVVPGSSRFEHPAIIGPQGVGRWELTARTLMLRTNHFLRTHFPDSGNFPTDIQLWSKRVPVAREAGRLRSSKAAACIGVIEAFLKRDRDKERIANSGDDSGGSGRPVSESERWLGRNVPKRGALHSADTYRLMVNHPCRHASRVNGRKCGVATHCSEKTCENHSAAFSGWARALR